MSQEQYKFKRKLTRIELVSFGRIYKHFYIGWTTGNEMFRIMFPFLWLDIHLP